MITHQGLCVDAFRRRFGVARLFGGDRKNLVMVNAGSQVGVPRQIPNFLESIRVVDRSAFALHHNCHGERIAEIRMILIHLNEGMILRKKIGEYCLKLDVLQAHRKKQRQADSRKQNQEAMIQRKTRKLVTKTIQTKLSPPIPSAVQMTTV